MPAIKYRPISAVFLIILLVFALVSVRGTSAENSETGINSYLYRVTTLRAEPGKLQELIDFLSAQREAANAGAPVDHAPIIMRHSQGDQWDLLLMLPMGSYHEYYGAGPGAGYSPDTVKLQNRLDRLSVFREDIFAYGPPPEAVLDAYAGNDFFHIEMFMALAGRKEDLIDERKMENAYLRATGQRTNMIWVADTGSDVDVFTIGFYPSIVEFAAPSGVSDEEANKAAVDAGFEARSTLGTYLRELISAHHDTLAVKVK